MEPSLTAALRGVSLHVINNQTLSSQCHSSLFKLQNNFQTCKCQQISNIKKNPECICVDEDRGQTSEILWMFSLTDWFEAPVATEEECETEAAGHCGTLRHRQMLDGNTQTILQTTKHQSEIL